MIAIVNIAIVVETSTEPVDRRERRIPQKKAIRVVVRYQDQDELTCSHWKSLARRSKMNTAHSGPKYTTPYDAASHTPLTNSFCFVHERWHGNMVLEQ